MTVALEKPVKREVTVDGRTFTVILSGAGIVVTPKRSRTGIELSWREIIAMPMLPIR